MPATVTPWDGRAQVYTTNRRLARYDDQQISVTASFYEERFFLEKELASLHKLF